VKHGGPIWLHFPGEHGGHPRQPQEICFGSFKATSTTLAAATSPTASAKVPATSDVAPSSGKKSKTHPPKPYDVDQGMERVIDMMEETLQICE
jgi:hypothetical protein